MNASLRRLLGSLVAAVSAAACADWLSGPKLSEDPNNPSRATPSQLLVAAEASLATQFEGLLARIGGIWTQQLAGVERQHFAYGIYNIDESFSSPEFSRVYIGGGLVDLRQIQSTTEAAGDSVFSGVAKVLEALVIGTAADIWGDIPYAEAAGDVATPRLDPQQDVYAGVHAKLDTAILSLAKSGGNNAGPGAADLIYGGDAAQWLEAAHTLKARFHLHLAEREPARYAQALAEAQLGISSPTNDFRTFHGTAATESNIWYQFLAVQRTGDVAAGKFLVELLQSRSDPRLAQYFAPNGAGGYGGSDPGEGSTTDLSQVSPTRAAPDFRQPLITWGETQLIIAEAQNRAGDDVAALGALNAVRTDAGLAPLAGVTGAALLDSILVEKYVVLFQNIEAWATYQRTCVPRITAAAPATAVPGRLYYGFDERNTNPNIPAPGVAPNTEGPNWNDPNPC